MLGYADPSSRFYGVYRGRCVNPVDPDSSGRIQLQVPQILGEAVTTWAYNSTSCAVLPEIGDGVWVMFEGGDPNFPVWTGVF